MSLTTNERKVLELLLNSEYHDGSKPFDGESQHEYETRVCQSVHTDVISSYFGGKRQFSGVVSSLCQKWLIASNGETIHLTLAGLHTLGSPYHTN